MGLRLSLPKTGCVAGLLVVIAGLCFAFLGAERGYASTLSEYGDSAGLNGDVPAQAGAAAMPVSEYSQVTTDPVPEVGSSGVSGQVVNDVTALVSGDATGVAADTELEVNGSVTAGRGGDSSGAGQGLSANSEEPAAAGNNENIVLIEAFSPDPSPARGVDHDADSHDELAVLYDYGNANTGLLLFQSTGSSAAPGDMWLSGAGNWEWSRSKITAVDVNGDGQTELAVLYDYGNANTGLLLFNPTGSGYGAPSLVWSSGAGNWEWSRSKITAVDVNGDGKTELAVLYDYGNANTGLLLFNPTGSGYGAPGMVWSSGAGNWEWSRSKIAAVDVNGDGKTELAVLYDYGNANTGLLLFNPTGSGFGAPGLVWASGVGNWEWLRSKMTAADYNGDGRTELAVLYDYGNANTGLLLFNPTGSGFGAPGLVWASGAGNWEWSRSRITAVDLNGDSNTELAIFYDYGNANTGLLLFDPTGSGYAAPHNMWLSGAGNWESDRSKTVKADYFKPRFFVISVEWLDVNLSTQTLSAYGAALNELEERYFVYAKQFVFTTLVSTGKPGWETPTGVYYVIAKERSVDMRSGGDWSEQYYVPGVPYVLWFIDRLYAIHGAYWYVNYGHPSSHGCVDLNIQDSAWIYARTPVGTRIVIHY